MSKLHAVSAALDATRRLLTFALVDGGWWLHVRRKDCCLQIRRQYEGGWKLH